MSNIEKVHKFSILSPKRRSFLDTSEQVVHGRKPQSVQSLKKQALKIKIRNSLVSPLLEYGISVDSPNVKEYWRSLKCCTILEQSQNKYLKPPERCGSRTCPICNNIRTAKIMERIMPNVDLAKKYGMLVLTRSNKDLEGADAIKLRNTIDRLYKFLSIIRQRVKRKFGNPDILISLEVGGEGYKKRPTGGIYWGYYNPHFNLLGEYEVLQFIKAQWLKMVNCTEINQKLNEVKQEDIKKSVLEVVKYTTKGITDYKKGSFINLEAIDTIITAIKGKRRIMTWGVFYKKAIKKIEDADINSLDLVKVPYYDLPVKDVGDFVDLHDSSGRFVTKVPEYAKSITWVYDNDTTNYHYLDEWGVRYDLLKWKKPPGEPLVYLFIGKQTFKKWKYVKLQNALN